MKVENHRLRNMFDEAKTNCMPFCQFDAESIERLRRWLGDEEQRKVLEEEKQRVCFFEQERESVWKNKIKGKETKNKQRRIRAQDWPILSFSGA